MEAWQSRVCLQDYDTRFIWGLAQGWKNVLFGRLNAPQNVEIYVPLFVVSRIDGATKGEAPLADYSDFQQFN